MAATQQTFEALRDPRRATLSAAGASRKLGTMGYSTEHGVPGKLAGYDFEDGAGGFMYEYQWDPDVGDWDITGVAHSVEVSESDWKEIQLHGSNVTNTADA